MNTAHLLAETAPFPGDRRHGRCPICAGTDLEILPFRYAFRGRFLYGFRCVSCTQTFIDPQPTDTEIVSMYGEEYFTECSETCGAHGRHAYMESAAGSTEERGRAGAKLDRLIRSHLDSGDRFLEIGCGPGFFLAEMRRQSWKVSGLEISEYAVQHATRELGLEVVHGSIENHEFPESAFDAVFMGDVLEHLQRPVQALREIRRWVRPAGILIVAVPSTLNLLLAELGMRLYRARRKFKTIKLPPYHLFEYTPRTLRQVLTTSGFHVVALRQSAVPIGRMGLRGSFIENAGKVTLQILAHLSARIWNRGGDRLLAIARRPGSPD